MLHGLKNLPIITREIQPMFDLIENQFSQHNIKESSKEAFPLTDLKKTREHRLAVIKKLILSIGQPLDYLLPSIRPLMLRDPFDMIPRANNSGDILIPTLCLVNKNELPSHLNITNPFDPRLKDPEWFKQFGLWLAEHLGTQIKAPNFLERENFRLYIKFLQNPDKASKAIQFILGHELGHIVYRHEGSSPLPGKIALLSAAIFGTTISYSLCVKNEAIEIATAKLCFGALVGMVSFVCLRTLRLLQKSRQNERLADQFSFKMNSTAAEGAIYLFDVLKKHYQTVKKEIPSSLNWREYLINHLIINSDGEIRMLNWTHDSFEERMKRAQNYSNQPNSGNSQFEGITLMKE